MNKFNLQQLYSVYFGTQPYMVDEKSTAQNLDSLATIKANRFPRFTEQLNDKGIALNKEGAFGREIWLPVEFWYTNTKVISIDICTIRIQALKTIVRTAVAERKGTVKEMFAMDDYKFTIKGFLVGENQTFPERQMMKLREIFETSKPVFIRNGLVELFMDENSKVAIESLEFPEQQGKCYWIQPFALQCESDFITDLIVE